MYSRFSGFQGAGKDVHSIYMFSDVDHIEQLLLTNSKWAHESIRKSVRRLKQTMKRFNKDFNQLTLTVHYVGNPDVRNLYYRSAHLAARRVACIRR
ncbi:hypothetical protein [Alicyclobacillus dauci]|uniref:Uncharacterized protein n=1 Tax=Alicyclobacillus dauci TaxID=1475485 RepID=A0ABY6Z9N0_9BACL|nr:hypothetical protein [Alicyclobacillus dauci]WAH38876.1 hypothetical protein NZD86_10550 [Alicyclobacillus dauci]